MSEKDSINFIGYCPKPIPNKKLSWKKLKPENILKSLLELDLPSSIILNLFMCSMKNSDTPKKDVNSSGRKYIKYFFDLSTLINIITKYKQPIKRAAAIAYLDELRSRKQGSKINILLLNLDLTKAKGLNMITYSPENDGSDSVIPNLFLNKSKKY